MRLKLIALFSLAAFVLSFPSPVKTQEKEKAVRVIVHKSNPTSSLTQKELSRIFLKKKLKWPHKINALPVDQAEDSPARKAFTKTILKRSISSVTSYWQKMVFSARATPPYQLLSDSEIIEFVAQNEGAVGYISPATSLENENVKVLAIINTPKK